MQLGGKVTSLLCHCPVRSWHSAVSGTQRELRNCEGVIALKLFTHLGISPFFLSSPEPFICLEGYHSSLRRGCKETDWGDI